MSRIGCRWRLTLYLAADRLCPGPSGNARMTSSFPCRQRYPSVALLEELGGLYEYSAADPGRMP